MVSCLLAFVFVPSRALVRLLVESHAGHCVFSLEVTNVCCWNTLLVWQLNSVWLVFLGALCIQVDSYSPGEQGVYGFAWILD